MYKIKFGDIFFYKASLAVLRFHPYRYIFQANVKQQFTREQKSQHNYNEQK